MSKNSQSMALKRAHQAHKMSGMPLKQAMMIHQYIPGNNESFRSQIEGAQYDCTLSLNHRRYMMPCDFIGTIQCLRSGRLPVHLRQF